jgi:tRNA/rRNA methyltransferase
MAIGGGLHVINPLWPDREKMLKMATHEAASLVEEMVVSESVEDTLAGFNYVFGTTARIGKRRLPTHTPRVAARHICDMALNNRVGILFGSEDKGLSNQHIDMCHGIIHIPTSTFSSINLAQSVMIVVYEIFITSKGSSPTFSPRLATLRELEGMYGHIRELFDRVGFVKSGNPEYWPSRVKRMLDRYPLRARDVKMIRGFCRDFINILDRYSRGEQG